MNFGYKFISLLLLATALSGCVTEPIQTGFSPDGEEQDGVISPRRGTRPAVLQLLGEAREASRAGQLHRAESLLERAIRIEPRNPVLWHYMAKVHLYRGRPDKAEGMAAKSNSLAGADAVLKSDNWRIIAHSRQARGDKTGARQAQKKAAELANGS